MLDTSRLERAGVPTATVITTAFVREAQYQADVSGMSSYSPVVVPHPTSHLPEPEIQALATRIVPEVLARLLRQPA